MTNSEAKRSLMELYNQYQGIPNPKYRYIDAEACERMYRQLKGLKSEVSDQRLYQFLLGALSQILAKRRRLTNPRDSKESGWLVASERGINKAIQPLVRKPGMTLEYPFEGKDPVTGHACSISNGQWGARNYMVMDLLAYFYLLKIGNDRLPEQASSLFNDMESIRKRELEHSKPATKCSNGQTPLETDEIKSIKESENWVSFDDSDFRKFTGIRFQSNDILRLLQETSRVEFKLVYPVRLKDESNRHREKTYAMNMFSRLFEFGYIDEDVRGSDGIVRMRRYYVTFNTILGELFVHNLKAKNYDWVGRELYSMPPSAQVFFRRCLVHNDNPFLEFNLETIAQRVHLTDKHRSNLVKAIINYVLDPLLQNGMIQSYDRRDGLSGTKFQIYRKFETKKLKGWSFGKRSGGAIEGHKQSIEGHKQTGEGHKQSGEGQEQKIAGNP
jgi:hypothetical protein